MSIQWEILDDNGCIYSGDQEMMLSMFNKIVNENKDNKDHPLNDVTTKGDIKLVEVHGVTR